MVIGCVSAGAVYICTQDVFPTKRLRQLTQYFSQRHTHSHPSLTAQHLSDNIFVEHVATIVSSRILYRVSYSGNLATFFSWLIFNSRPTVRVLLLLSVLCKSICYFAHYVHIEHPYTPLVVCCSNTNVSGVHVVPFLLDLFPMVTLQ